MTQLSADNVSLNAGQTELFAKVNLSLAPGKLSCLIGPNGAGKSSLLTCLAGLKKPATGTVLLNGENLSGMSSTERAKQLSYLPQNRQLSWPISVEDAVALGRFAYGGTPARLSEADRIAVDEALDICELNGLRKRATDTLSGGELSRVHFARAFAGKAPLLIADEPLTALDPKHQLRVMRLIQRFTENGGTALVVLHDIALAAQFADVLLWMRFGRLVDEGSPAKTLTEQNMSRVFDVSARIEDGRLVSITDA